MQACLERAEQASHDDPETVERPFEKLVVPQLQHHVKQAAAVAEELQRWCT
jgi:hypothetical protein